ncbi:hypothetical protein [Pseudomonas allokribbensis]|uniref:hypothetical protein n=1 Tax=Pseudomonas allokribbensis TaxID=2774460 RepID=UPI0017887546|nr:hypothetical protein [Pseudomonas allokribbensis]
MKEIKDALHAAAGKGARKVIAAQADIYENATLANEYFSDECLELITYILSTEDLFNKPGMHVFIVKIHTDMDILSDNQKQKLLDTVSLNYQRYNQTDLCWHLGDLIARCYDSNLAMNFFQHHFVSATPQGKEGIALGLDILARHSKRDPKIMKKIETILKGEN